MGTREGELTRNFSLIKHRTKELFDQSSYNSISNLNATVFGATGSIGSYLASRLGDISSDLTYPTRQTDTFADTMKDLRCQGSTGMVYMAMNMNMGDLHQLTRVNRHSDVIINLLGPSRFMTSKYEDFKFINMEVPQKIARSARLTGAKKLIHFSAAGAQPNSDSLDLKTKFFGEQMVRDEFPDAVILRPTIVLSRRDYYLKYWADMMDFFHSFVPVYDDCLAKKQPILVFDVVEAIVNSIKLDNAQGRTFELGGPFQYTQKEILELMMNGVARDLKIFKFNKELAKMLGSRITSRYLNREDVIKSGIDQIVRQENGEGNIHDLFIQPGSIAPFIKIYFHKMKNLQALSKKGENI